ncbi:MAG TPA: hypothetical protein VEY93_12595 [Longimicrobium sp.]|nr:hypothetical protein [Longimicrobium sp.]
MPEPGGPGTQTGIYFQNSIAALYLGRLLDLRTRSARSRVIHVRVEAPTSVDDVVVRMADQTREFVQVKYTLSASGAPWTRLWETVSRQIAACTVDDRVKLIIGEPSTLANDLREAAERTNDSLSPEEWELRLSDAQRRLASSICGLVGDAENDSAAAWRVLQQVDVEIIDARNIDRDHAPLWMPKSSMEPDQLLSKLRDIAGGAARVRGSFDAAVLRMRLELQGIRLAEPENWGAQAYREIIIRRAVIEVPGTGHSELISNDFLWPRAFRYDRARPADFDDELPRYSIGVRADQVDVSRFGQPGLTQIIVVAGPGFGKSVLTLALARSAALAGRIPVIIPIPELSRLDTAIGDYLDGLNSEYQLSINWSTVAETGLLMLLFDGLDEVATSRRSIVLERIKRYTHRYPMVPWLLTVRDAAALSAPTDGALVELQPLTNDEILRFVEAHRPNQPEFVEGLRRQMEARPDLLRLMRIPLFLSVMLATTSRNSALPENRTELLESYLDLLFRPEAFKMSEHDDLDPALLRPIAEQVAFEALEREEIGVTRRLLESVVRSHIGNGVHVQAVLDRLTKCGVIRGGGIGRFVFPFPIVQEYLAACYILSNRSNEVATRLASAVKRPWAQALQFVLEQHPNPNTLAEQLLSSEDDAFHTQLRLLARSVANGMAVDEDTKAQIARRLVPLWETASWYTAGRIGELIADAYYSPLIPEIRSRLGQYFALHQGGGSIVTRIGDPELTKAVVSELIDGTDDGLYNLAELQQAVDALGTDALRLYLEKALDPMATEGRHNTIAILIRHLDCSRVPPSAWGAFLDTEGLPDLVRLSLFSSQPGSLDPRAIPLTAEALAKEDYAPRSLAVEALCKTSDPMSSIRSMLIDSDYPLHTRLEFLDLIPWAAPVNIMIATELGRDPLIDPQIQQCLMVFAARFGDSDAMRTMISQFADLPFHIIREGIALFGHHRSRQYVEMAIEKLRLRAFTVVERTAIFHSAVLGMIARYDMIKIGLGTIADAPLHPGIDLFRSLLEEWVIDLELDPVSTLKIETELAQLGSAAATERLHQQILRLFSDEAVDFTADDAASTIGAAIRTLQDNDHLLDLVTLNRIVRHSSWNGVTDAVQMIAAHASRDAFDMLTEIHYEEGRERITQFIVELVEQVAGRLGLRVRLVEGRLVGAE